MKHITTGLLLAAAVSVCSAAQADMMESFNRAFRDAAGLSTPEERRWNETNELLKKQHRQLLEEQSRQQYELQRELYRLRERLR